MTDVDIAAVAPGSPIKGQTKAEAQLDKGWGNDFEGNVLFWIAVAFSAFQIVTATFSPLPSQIVRSVHVGFLLIVVFGVTSTLTGRIPAKLVYWALGITGFVLGFYHWVFYEQLILRAGDPNIADIVVGVIVVALVFEAGRRMMGPILPLICATFLAYGLFGQYLPSPLNTRGYEFNQIIDQMFLGTEGIYGIPVYVSSTYIFLFILFGAFLERAGMIGLFTDVAMGTVGHARGGPAKVAVIASGLMGTINGSGIANVVTVGQFTIPLMKRYGYPAYFAGAVEATSSMGGQIMPPVMGAVAFIMAETINVPYSTICIAAIVPALLYYYSAFWAVHLEAGKRGLVGLAKDDCPHPIAALKKNWFLLMPLAALVVLLFAGYTPLFAGTVGLGLTVMVIFSHPIVAAIPQPILRIAFWILLGLSAALFFEYGVWLLISMVVLLMAVTVLGQRRTRDVESGAQQPCRRRPPRAAGRRCLRAGRHHHRHADADGRGDQFRACHRLGRRELDLFLALPHGAHLADPRHGHPDHPELHHHLLDRGTRFVASRRAADRVAHVRVLFRHHGGPDAAGGACRLCRRLDRQRERLQDRLDRGEDRAAGMDRALHGGLCAGFDAATGRRARRHLRPRGRRGLCDFQGGAGGDALGRDRHRLFPQPCRMAGTHHRLPLRRAFGDGIPMDRPGRIYRLRRVPGLSVLESATRPPCRLGREAVKPAE